MAKDRQCEECGERKRDVQRIADPFAASVNNEIWMRDLCENDANARAEES